MTRRERLERKLEKREEWADKAQARSEERFGAADRAVAGIPFGQPILIGHHSEKRHRRAIERCHDNMQKGVEESKLASHHSSKAVGLERILDTNIFDDDPDAIERLEERIKAQELSNERAKTINKAFRRGGWDAVRATGLMSEALIATTQKTMELCPWIKNPLSTDTASIRRDRQRIETIKRRQERAAKAEVHGLLVETLGTTEWSQTVYVRVTFAEKPARSVLDELKAAGFTWGNGSWTGEEAKLPASVQAMRDAALAQYVEGLT